MKHPGKWLLALVLAALVAGCGQVEIRNPFADGVQTTPLQGALAGTKTAIEAAGEWYVDACVLRLPGVAADREVCETYRSDVDPALVTLQNLAVAVAQAVEADAEGIALVSVAMAQANTALIEFGRRYDLLESPWVRGIVVAIETLRQRLVAAAGAA